MASTRFAASSWALSSLDYSSTNPQPLEPTPTNNETHDNNILDAHRQNHNSSKLPAFRFADLRKDRISLPSLHQRTPLAPVLSQTVAVDPPEPTRRIPESSHSNSLHRTTSTPTLPDRPAALESNQNGAAAPRTRSFKIRFSSPESASANAPVDSKRPVSFPETQKHPSGTSATQSQPAAVAAPAIKRRLTESAIQESAQGRRELLLPKTLESVKLDNEKSCPPVSYKLPVTASAESPSSGRAVVLPIRSSRSSGSRKSVILDMPTRHMSGDSYQGEAPDNNSQRDRALRALEGQRDEGISHLTPAESGEMTTTTDNDNTADIFMKIAGEDPAPRASERQEAHPETGSTSRIVRVSHRRPFSTSSPAQDTASSPPRLSRRLSDQRESSRSRQVADNQTPPQSLSRESSYRTPGRESLPPIATSVESSSRSQLGRNSSRPSPITPRQISFKDSFAESSSAYQRRRQSLTENNNVPSPRTAQYRSSNLAVTQPRTYHSSPLVPKSTNVLADGQQHSSSSEANHAVEGTESSSSTAAQSSVWDELDDLKSRIQRLELTGKMPPSLGGGAEGNNNQGAPRDAQPLLISALSKTKSLVSPEVFNAIESAATDALALSSMIGPVGQPGPISSSASAVGGYSGGVTDRQLRKKAESICRSLTELCLALADSTGPKKQPRPAAAVASEQETVVSPTSHLAVGDMPPSQRRPSAIAETIAKGSTSPRAPSSLEQKRKTMLASISVPVPTTRYVAAPATPLESTAGRKSSLLLSRIRRLATEEPEETQTQMQAQSSQAGRRSSLLLRSRRNGSEEPEENREGRRTSLLLRTRKTTSDAEEEPRARVPSRAVTEVNNFHPISRDTSMPAASAQTAAPEGPATPSALPRRRMIPLAIATRLASAVPSASTPTTPARRYLERTSLQERSTPQERGAYQERGSYLERSAQQERAINTLAERLAEERGQQQQRQLSLGQATMLNRSGSLGRRTRETGIPSLRSGLSG
ncbi:uncharacterized protein P884DRAFT_234785 [Thermothelomyces heterothallicus CBS 202.75]|uniref:uncharacterized protein n=1 Tax=Thermothelomyces heterothallicus CBS 202.75 TaxID=1149848 RepID=UPI003742A13D